ncbi:MAG: glycosyl hydrolase family 8 [Candidatus Melainabacteria bacterium]
MTGKWRKPIALAGCVLMAVAGLSVAGCLDTRSRAEENNEGVLLRQSWSFFKSRFVPGGERVASNNYGGTITEGQSYSLLKSVLLGDRETFEKTWRWTKTHMQRQEDHLFGWEWGQREDGAWGLKYQESAPDADQDIAYALLLAAENWDRPDYAEAAKAIIADFWTVHVRQIHGRYYLASGDWEGFHREYFTLNPSYFAPYVYRKFAEVDAEHAEGWKQLAADIYPTLTACSALTANHLPPNWCAVQYESGEITFSDRQGEGARNFGYDAHRVFWRMATDAALGSAEAKAYLKDHQYLLTYWKAHHRLPEQFTEKGKPVAPENSGFTLSAALALNHVVNPGTDEAMYAAMLAPHYHPEGYWFNDYNDFLQSVIWLHLYTLTLPVKPAATPSS